MGLRIQVPGLSYFSIDLVRELLRHTLWSSGSVFARRVAHLLFLLLRYQLCPSLIDAQSGGRDGFLFRPSRIPFLNVVQRWSPFASASGSDDCSFVVAFVDYLFKLDIYLYISMYIQAEYRRLGVIIFVLLFPVPVISFLLLRVVLLRLRVAEEFLFISARRRAYHL